MFGREYIPGVSHIRATFCDAILGSESKTHTVEVCVCCSSENPRLGCRSIALGSLHVEKH